MRCGLAGLPLILWSSALVAQVPLRPTLLVDTATDSRLAGWHLTGGDPAAYRLVLDSSFGASGEAVLLAPRTGATAATWAAAVQVLRADRYRGRRVLLTAECRYDAVATAGLWLRADGLIFGDPGTLTFDGMATRPLHGTGGWRTVRIVLDIPPNAEYLALGSHLTGTGRLWLRHLTLTVSPPPWFAPTVKGYVAHLLTEIELPHYYAALAQAQDSLLPP